MEVSVDYWLDSRELSLSLSNLSGSVQGVYLPAYTAYLS